VACFSKNTVVPFELQYCVLLYDFRPSQALFCTGMSSGPNRSAPPTSL
jgi:hypothetical protein